MRLRCGWSLACGLVLALPFASRAHAEAAASPQVIARDTNPPARHRAAPPELARSRHWLSLDMTGVDQFRTAQPLADGRGVLIAILDSGIDPGIPGLIRTPDGGAKLLDARDFSGEGQVNLTPAELHADTVLIEGRALTGMTRVAARTTGPWYGGVIDELALGLPPAADLDGNGSARDHLPLLVGRASDGWVLYVDADGDGSFANERPVHDYLIARETFGWSSGGRASPLTIAANFATTASGLPTLDLFFDTSGHGSHVAGIAAAYGMYDLPGLDGVAPGAQLLGLKIANDALGAISTTQSMRNAMDYAMRFAEARRMPLVLNMSFGVGNEHEGAARIDAVVDSFLAANPDVVMVISAGNDGPALSTLGFPGSASRAITTGAVLPGRFVAAPASRAPAADAVAYFSARGGELSKPDIVAPGVAYSTVPPWDVGGEIEGGTSMAAPHAAGLVALLLSAAQQARLPVTATSLRRALMVTAGRLPAASYLEQGAGLPDVGRAWEWLKLRRGVGSVSVTSDAGTPGWLSASPSGEPLPTHAGFRVRSDSAVHEHFKLHSSADWLTAPAELELLDSASVSLSIDTMHIGRHPRTGVVSGWTDDTLAGPAFRLVVTVVRATGSRVDLVDSIPAGSASNLFFRVDSALPFNVRVATRSPGVQAFLNEPGGMPYRDLATLEAGDGRDAAAFQVDGSDALAGLWQVSTASSLSDAVLDVSVLPAPARMSLRRRGDSVVASFASLADTAVHAAAQIGLVGSDQRFQVDASGSAAVRHLLAVPSWARYVVVDVSMPAAQWERLTDFGLTLFDSAGVQLEQAPLNYAAGRLHHAFTTPPGQAALLLFPAFADSTNSAWSANVRVRFYLEEPVRLSTNGPRQIALAPNGETMLTLPWSEPEWRLGAGAAPLGIVTLETSAGGWTTEAALVDSATGLSKE